MQVILEDPYVKQVMSLFDQVNLALVGIGDIEPSKLLAQSGNRFSPQELAMLRNSGAVGDILLQFFDTGGNVVDSPLLNRVAAMDLEQLRNVDRAIGLAGGSRKFAAIRGALRGRWINILITDRITTERLLVES
jgi:DNA-binding transcriptional regulator LsrR (DeoR family)